MVQYMADNLSSRIEQYRVHVLIFFLVLLVGLTFAHPAIILNDEFITTSQLRQLHEGHQIIVNEGKYGFFENGTMTRYFIRKSNILAYSLYLPLISLPAYWIIDLTGEHFVYLILLLWTISALILVFFIQNFFRSFTIIGKCQWVPCAYGLIFLVFFINLYLYTSFPVDSVENFPEILAIVFTNIILFSISGVMIYEINRTIFDDPSFSFFGTIVCLFSSSYFLWVTYCKDHVAVLPVFIGIILCLVRFMKTDEFWYLPLAFLLCGTLAWGRPEIALGMFVAVMIIGGYTLTRYRCSVGFPEYPRIYVLISPVFTILGALPFLLNNFLLTKNFFLPTHSLYLQDTTTMVVANMSGSFSTMVGMKSPLAVIMRFIPSLPSSPAEALTDIGGIIFYPQNGSISVLAVVPIAFVMICVAGFLLVAKRLFLSEEERKNIVLLLLTTGAVSFSYISLIHLLNTDPGIVPDIRYLMPVYLPLTLFGLISLRKTRLLSGDRSDIRDLVIITITGLVVSVVLLPILYLQNLRTIRGYPPLEEYFSILTLALVILTLVSIALYRKSESGGPQLRYLVLLLCIVPFLWQINETFMVSIYCAYAKYTFWIPVISYLLNIIQTTAVNLI